MVKPTVPTSRVRSISLRLRRNPVPMKLRASEEIGMPGRQKVFAIVAVVGGTVIVIALVAGPPFKVTVAGKNVQVVPLGMPEQ